MCPRPPLNIHQLIVTRLTLALAAACPDHLAERPPALVVEVSSPSTGLYDRNRKKDVYETFGIPAYWIVETDAGQPRLIAFELQDGKYQTVADVSGSEEFRATSPFPVAIRPAVLTRTGHLTG